jgi:hypothetical protein
VKRREGIGGVTIAVVGLVLALSVGIAATAKGGVSKDAATAPPVGAPDRSANPTSGASVAGTTSPAGVVQAGVAKGTMTNVLVETVVSQSGASPPGPGGSCIVKTRIVTNTPTAPRAQVRPGSEIRRPVTSRGGRAGRGIKV